MIQVLVVDDEPLARQALVRLIAKDGDFKLAGEAADGDEALQKIKEGKIDIVFLDIEMPGLNGLEVLSRLNTTKNPPRVVFTTAYDQYAIEAFEANAVDYILKPYEEERIQKSLKRLRALFENKQAPPQNLEGLEQSLASSGLLKRLVGYPPRSKVKKVIDPADVLYFEAKFGEVMAHTDAGPYELRSTLAQVMAVVDPARFVQVHKTYIVNLEKVDSLEPLFHGNYEIILKGPKALRIPLSRNYLEPIKKLLEGW